MKFTYFVLLATSLSSALAQIITSLPQRLSSLPSLNTISYTWPRTGFDNGILTVPLLVGSRNTYAASVLAADSISSTYLVTCLNAALHTQSPIPLDTSYFLATFCPTSSFTLTQSNINYALLNTATQNGTAIYERAWFSVTKVERRGQITYHFDRNTDPVLTPLTHVSQHDIGEWTIGLPTATISVTGGLEKIIAASTVSYAPPGVGTAGASDTALTTPLPSAGTASARQMPSGSQGTAGESVRAGSGGKGVLLGMTAAAGAVAVLAVML